MNFVKRIVLIALPLLFLLLTNRWMGWSEGIHYLQADDTQGYLTIAEAAPSFPDQVVLYEHAQRFFIHSLTGTFSKLTGVSLPGSYYLFLALILGLTLLILDKIFVRLKLPPFAYALCMSVFIINPYTFRYYLIVPAMLADNVFVLGFSAVLLGLLNVQLVPLIL